MPDDDDDDDDDGAGSGLTPSTATDDEDVVVLVVTENDDLFLLLGTVFLFLVLEKIEEDFFIFDERELLYFGMNHFDYHFCWCPLLSVY